MAVYLVEDSKGNKTLVETRTKVGAINFVSQNESEFVGHCDSEAVWNVH